MTHESLLSIGALSRLAGVSEQTIRYYERLGLVESAGRTQGGSRQFSPETVRRIQTIKGAQGLGFSLNEIHDLLKVDRKSESTCKRAQRVLKTRMERLRVELGLLQRCQDVVRDLQKTCDQCEGLCHLEEELSLNATL